MKPADVPQRYLDMLNQAAGREHSRTGSVVACLAEILTEYLGAAPDPDPSDELEALDPSQLMRVLIHVQDAEGWQWSALAYVVSEVMAAGAKALELPQSSTLDDLPRPLRMLDITVVTDDRGAGLRRIGVDR